MKKMIHDLFSESSNMSMMRLMSFMICVTACYLAIERGPEELAVISMLVASAIGGKVGQKVVEVKGQQAQANGDK